VELHGGTVTATSDGPNRGAQFEVKLPLRPVPLADDDVERSHARPRLAGVSVLVVDDNPHDLELVRASLEQYGARVQTAGTARDAREQHRKEPSDVFVSDLRLPDTDGWQLMREIRQIDELTGRHTPAAAVSALARSDDRRRTLDAGYRLHVAKPIDPAELAAAVEQLAREGHA
jgi:CheY-like chemotaxis protein